VYHAEWNFLSSRTCFHFIIELSEHERFCNGEKNPSSCLHLAAAGSLGVMGGWGRVRITQFKIAGTLCQQESGNLRSDYTGTGDDSAPPRAGTRGHAAFINEEGRLSLGGKNSSSLFLRRGRRKRNGI
jgi:hypothetical protein